MADDSKQPVNVDTDALVAKLKPGLDYLRDADAEQPDAPSVDVTALVEKHAAAIEYLRDK
jgi:hypothetical protein